MMSEPAAIECGESTRGDTSGGPPDIEATAPRARRKRRWVMQYLPDEVNRVLRDYDAGLNAKDIGERHGVSKATLYRWIAQFEDQRTVDDDPGSMRMRIAVLEKTVLHLSTDNAELRAAAKGIPAVVDPKGGDPEDRAEGADEPDQEEGMDAAS